MDAIECPTEAFDWNILISRLTHLKISEERKKKLGEEGIRTLTDESLPISGEIDNLFGANLRKSLIEMATKETQ